MKSSKSAKSKESSSRGESTHGTDASSTLPSFTSVVCCNERDAIMSVVVGKVVNHTVFPKKTFHCLGYRTGQKRQIGCKMFISARDSFISSVD